jgi:hypothetical protein
MFGELNADNRINRGLWPPASTDLNSCDFIWEENQKNIVYSNNPHDLEALKTEYSWSSLQHSVM